jgi:hypothetical protein
MSQPFPSPLILLPRDVLTIEKGLHLFKRVARVLAATGKTGFQQYKDVSVWNGRRSPPWLA